MIRFSVTVNNPTQLCIYDITGRNLRSWDVHGEVVVDWNKTDQQGISLPEGRYFAVVKGGDISEQVLILK